MVANMAQKAAKISGEKFYSMEMEGVLSAINLEPRGNYRTYKGKIYLGGASGLRYGEEVVAFQVLYNRMIDEGIITGKKISEDGKYGDETAAAIKNLQKQINEKTGMGILVDGYFGIETWSGTLALLTGNTAMLEEVMGKPARGKVPERVTMPEEEEQIPTRKNLEDFSKDVKRITKKSSPNERFEWEEEYGEELYEMGVVLKDDEGKYVLSEDARTYLSEYNKDQKKDWKVTKTDLEAALNGEKEFTNKEAKAIAYIIERYMEEETAITPEPSPVSGGEFVIPKEIMEIVEREKDPEAKRKMLAALEMLKKSENPEEIIEYWLAQEDLRKTLITAGSELAG
ncbi:MAG: hypothetical protein QXL47_00455 [Candidatus Anstonellales archaeon]